MTIAYVGVGSNIDKHLHIERAIKALSELDLNARFSTIYESPALGFEGDSFFNLVAEITTSQTLLTFAQTLRDIEFRLGRTLDAQKKQSRTIDLDIILFGDCISEDVVKVPRQDIYDYPFVIQPLFELNPELAVPDGNRLVKEIWAKTKNLDSLSAIEPWFEI